MTPAGQAAAPTPARVEQIGDELAIIWADGHESFYQPQPLRDACPCALCRAARGKDAGEPKPSAFQMFQPSARIVAIEEVGRYALRLHWSDRHASGIYDFRLLRSLCSCDGCREASRETTDAD